MKSLEIVKVLCDLVSKNYNSEGGRVCNHITDNELGIVLFLQEIHYREYRVKVDEFWGLYPRLDESVLYDEFDKDVFKFLGKIEAGIVELKEESINNFINQYLEHPVQKWEIFKPVYNAVLVGDNPITVGGYTLYDVRNHKALLIEKFIFFEEYYRTETKFIEQVDTFISLELNNRSGTKAEALSLPKFQEFENILRFMIGMTNVYDVTVINYKPIGYMPTFVYSEENGFSNHSVNGKFSRFEIKEDFVCDSSCGYNRIWEIGLKDKKNDMENRIYSAIQWIGKGLNEQSLSNSFVQYMFALESLFNLQSKGSLVTPSIANQLSEFTAFVLGKNLADRLEINRIVKRMYDKRSAIAHGRSNSVTQEDVRDAYWILKDAIIRLLTDEELSVIGNIDGLKGWVENKKFS
ncbi:hypothetical protein D3C76_320470 [compost metagenome]